MKETFKEQREITCKEAVEIITTIRPELRHDSEKILTELLGTKILQREDEFTFSKIDPALLVKELVIGSCEALDDMLSVTQILEWMKGDLKKAISDYRKKRTPEEAAWMKHVGSFYREELKKLRRIIKQEREELELKKSLSIYEPLGLAVKMEEVLTLENTTKNTRTRVLNALDKEGLTYAFQLVRYPEKELKKLPGIGVKGVNIINTVMHDYRVVYKERMETVHAI